ncbi:winged helix-turn-helix domain-containing protein [Streptomyces sp. NPDC002838]|uniref:winged helix-turn-helix domain-containing protein n=1 Tax=Streptomyces sp. NPDC002838 TaxID=3154436 RepID=UPI00331D4248
MRYAHGGGLTPKEQEKRERVRLEAAERFARGEKTEVVAGELRWKLLRRHGWSAQVPLRRAIERDDEAIEVWKAKVWPQVKGPRRTWAPTSASRTRQARG